MAVRRKVAQVDFGLIQPAESTTSMSGAECVACMDAARLSNRQVMQMLRQKTDHEVRNWTGVTRWPCPPPISVQAWLRRQALAHLQVDRDNPPPVLNGSDEHG